MTGKGSMMGMKGLLIVLLVRRSMVESRQRTWQRHRTMGTVRRMSIRVGIRVAIHLVAREMAAMII